MTGKRAFWGLGLAIAGAAALLAATIGMLAFAQPVSAHSAAPLQERAAGRAAVAAETLSISKFAQTGSGNGVVFNGQPITYTIIITNNSASYAATGISIFDVLPPATLDSVTCLNPCEPIFTEQQVPEPTGGTLLVTVTTELSWTVGSLAPQGTIQLVFTGRVVGQTDGTVFKNRAFATYALNGAQGAASTPDVLTTVRAQISQLGQPSLASAPTWFSSDVGGTLSQDWGDFNGDGQLDLVLGSSLGVSVYINQNGQLKPYWNNFSSHRPAYGVRWADINHDGKLEIASVGSSLNGTAVTSGTTYLYGPAASSFAQMGSFVTDYQMVRIAVGDFTGHKNLDIIASTNTLNADCPVQLFVNDGSGNFARSPNCVSHAATAALGPADVENNGRIDLAVGVFPNVIEILRNNGSGVFTTTAPIVVDNNVPFLPYDFAWGDYDGNGLLDLAAAFPLQKEARVYRDLGNGVFDSPMAPFRTTKFLSPLSVAWGDFNGDGALDLAVADEIPKVYLNQQGTIDQANPLAASTIAGQIWSLRAEQIDTSGDLQLSLSNRDAPSLLFDSFGSHLSANLIQVNGNSQAASSLAVGDADTNGTIDMVFGAAPLPVQGTEIDYNTAGNFPAQLQLPSGPGPQTIALGDVNGDGSLDIAVGTAVEAQLYLSGQTVTAWSAAAPNGPNHVVAFCDVNSDGRLDLLVGSNGGGVALYLNQGGALAASPSFTTSDTGNVQAIACADTGHSHYSDFAVAFDNQPVQLYHNNIDGTFSSIWNSGTHSHTTSLAWGDFNVDGFVDLAMGTRDQGTHIYENISGHLQSAPIWNSPTQWSTTAIAWGDWNNDGQLDLAVGNNGQPAQVFGNLGSTVGQPRLFWLWTANDSYQTTGLAWGDFNGDGHMDLALSQKGACCNGYYRNGSVNPSHLSDAFVPTLSLPNNPTYLYVQRPGTTADGYANSASEILGGPNQPTVTVSYTLYDANGSRKSNDLNAPGNRILTTTFQYSVDGGSHWLTASAAPGSPSPITATSRLGQTGTFFWNVQKDKPVSDDARFRVRVVPFVPVGPVQTAAALAVSPPFRVHGVSCVWPLNPTITVSQNPVSPTVPAGFFGSVSAGSGALTYTWSFGDSPLPIPPTFLGQAVQHTFSANGTYTVTLTVAGELCPQNRNVVVKQAIQVDSGQVAQKYSLYLPAISSGTAGDSGAASSSASARPTLPSSQGRPAAVMTVKVNAVPPELALQPLAPALAAVDPPAAAVQVTTSTVGINNEPSLNGDGTRVAYWSTANTTGNNPDGNIEVYLLISDTGGLSVTQITSSTGSILGGFNLSPSIDRAGARVVFFSDRDLVGENPDQNFEIYYYDVNTAVLRQVTHTTKGFNILPSISGDGRYIAFASDRDFLGTNPDGNTEIFRAQILPVGGITFTQVTNTAGGVNDQPRINDDGTRIAFVSDHNLDTVHSANGDNNREVFLANVGPSGPVTFTQLSDTTSGTTGEPSIDGVGQRVAFVSNRTPVPAQPILNPSNLHEIYYADVDGSGGMTVTRVTTSQVEIGNDQPTISGDGTRIGSISPNVGQVRIYDTLLGAELTATVGSALNPSLSGDGTVVMYALNRQLYTLAYRLTKLTVTKTASTNAIYQSELFSYTVVLSNAGPSAANNIVLTDTLGTIASASPGWQLSSYNFNSPAGGVCSTITGSPITCTIASLAAHSAATLTVAITPTTYGKLTNSVIITTATPQRALTRPTILTVTVNPQRVAAVDLELSGPLTGTTDASMTFVAVVSPITASVPLTYTWSATNQTDVAVSSNSFTDTHSFAWNPGGVQMVTVTVTNAALNVVTATKTITIFNPAPSLASIFPTTATINSPQFTLALTGTGFVANSSVLWNNTPLASSYVTSATLQATVPFTDLTSVGPYTVAVFSPGPGGGQTSALTFTVQYPSPAITSISPITAATGGPTFTITITGSQFVSGASLYFGGHPALPTNFGSSNLLTATVPFGYLLSGGPINISVTNPSPSVGPSNTRPFTIINPTLTVDVSPAVIGLGQTATLTATISDLQAGDRVISLTSSNNSIASLPASVILPGGTASVTVTVQGGLGGIATLTGTLPASIGGASDSALLTVNNPTPDISQVSPVTTTAGGLTFTITLTGTNFVSGASLYWDTGAPLATFGSGTQVTASVPASYIDTPGAIVITVTNPSPSDNPSAPFAYTVVSPTISLTPSTLTLGSRVTGTLTATISAVQAADRVISITQTGLTLIAPSSVTLPAGSLSTAFVISGTRGTGTLTATLPSSLGGLADSVAITIFNAVPTISLIVPNIISVGVPITLDVQGTGFVPNSRVRWGATTLSQTVFVDDTDLNSGVPVGLFPTTGIYSVTVFTLAPGGGSSNVVTVTVINPSPTIASMSPVTSNVGSAAVTLLVTGTNFINGASQIEWNGVPTTTAFVNSTRLSATINANTLLSPGDYTVTVVTAGPGGGEAAPALTFTVVTTQPVISTIFPLTGTLDGLPFTLVVTGTGFLNPPDPSSASIIVWNNAPVQTFFKSSTVLTASISPLSAVGTYTVTVTNPQPPAGPDLVSNVKTFSVSNGAPLLTSLSPTMTTVSNVSVTLTLNGSGFVNRDSTVLWAGAPVSTTFINSTQLTIMLDPAKLAAAGSFTVAVTTAPPGGGTTAPLTFTVNNKAPTITTASPLSIALSSPTFSLIVTGTDFVNGAVVRWNNTSLTTNFVSASQLTATVAPANFPTGAVYTVTVLNPAPPSGGILSTNSVTVTVNNPQPVLNGLAPSTAVMGTPAFTLTITGTSGSFVSGAVAYWNGSPRSTTRVSNSLLQMGVLASDVATTATASITVQNPDPSYGISAALSLPVVVPTITLTPSTSQTITLPANGTLTLTISNAQAASTVISLTSSSPSTIAVPVTITLPANTTQQSFVLTTQNVSGAVTIQAQLPISLGSGVSNIVIVSAVDAPISGLAAVNNGPTTLGNSTLLTATITAGTHVSYTWNLGDGSAPTTLTTTSSVSYTYGAAQVGGYTAIVTATNPLGAIVTATTVVTINNPVPLLVSLNPTTTASSGTFTLTITGSNFVSGVQVHLQKNPGGGGGHTYTPASVTPTQIVVSVPGGDITAAGNYDITVINPSPPSTDQSNTLVLTVT